MDQAGNLRERFQAAEATREQLASRPDRNSQEYQDQLAALATAYGAIKDLIGHLSLFSHNEELDDIATNSLPFLMVDFYLGELVIQITNQDRRAGLDRATKFYLDFLTFLFDYGLLSKENQKLYHEFRKNPAHFSTSPINDAAARREHKISRFKEEKELKSKLQQLSMESHASNVDDEILRDLYLTQIRLSTSQTFQTLESTAQELEMLALIPAGEPSDRSIAHEDGRDRRQYSRDNYSEKLDQPGAGHANAGRNGPLLSGDGKLLRPFTLVSNREQLRQGVFRPGHNLPTMSIDEYLEEERRRGGIIEGGGPDSGIQPEPDEDNYEKSDAETMKAREWDEFTEANPKGSGNMINRG